jgi:pyrimidine operon attenuation protein / uracil phosphoribosyltransferase
MDTTQEIIDAKGFARTVTRLSHEIIERNKGAETIGIVGIRTRGDYLARRIAHAIRDSEQTDVPFGTLDITLYRDDLRGRLSQPRLKTTDILYDITGKNIILVDDVLFTGRTIRSALNALMDLGRPASIQLAVFVDRGHRELPIKADFVGKNIPTSNDQEISVLMTETDAQDAVLLITHIQEGEAR